MTGIKISEIVDIIQTT